MYKFNYRLFFAIMLLTFVPTIYETIRIYFISSIPDTSALNISGQMEWFDLIDETIKAFLLIPMYYVLNQVVEDKDLLKKRITSAGILIFIEYLLFSIVIYFYVTNLSSFMSVPIDERNEVINYLRLETIGFVVKIIPSFFAIVFLIINKSNYFYFTLLAQSILMIIGDIYFIPNFGVNGIAYSNILIQFILSILSIYLLYREKLLNLNIKTKDFNWIKSWFNVGFFSGGEIFLNNLIYAVMIGKMVNEVSSQGVYWVANSFIWGWLLVPVIALGEIIKKDCKDGLLNLKAIYYLKISGVIILIWILSIPLWNTIFINLMNLDNPNEVFSIVLSLLPFYMFYGLTNIIDSIFYGLGKTTYMFINSIIVNLGYYGILFTLYNLNIFKPTLNNIVLMFGFGMIVHFVCSCFLMNYYRKKVNKVNSIKNVETVTH